MLLFSSDAMEDNEDETEEEESDKILQEVLDDIGINMSHQVRFLPTESIFIFPDAACPHPYCFDSSLETLRFASKPHPPSRNRARQ
jgi:hypothetical protein